MFANCHTGDCINSSPAGKRRIAAEKQLSQLADEANLYGGDAALLEGSIDTFSSSNSNQNTSNTPLASVTVVAIAICSVIAIVFVTIFTVLQVSKQTKQTIWPMSMLRLPNNVRIWNTYEQHGKDDPYEIR